ncbi:MAG: hypothetical protein IKY98_01965 [Alphaproteobacteria bacterium]|nr:hypothetical protein [Alphaproteobacteria bacterium]
MKKGLLFFAVLIALCIASPVVAQELTQKRKTATFAPGLMMGGTSANAQKTQNQVRPQMQRYARTMILRFESGQTELSEIQREMLYQLAERLKKGQTIITTVYAVDSEVATARARNIERFLKSYAYYEKITRLVVGENVVSSTNNTVKLVIKD